MLFFYDREEGLDLRYEERTNHGCGRRHGQRGGHSAIGGGADGETAAAVRPKPE
jgi:hypothetical protein